MSKDQQRTRSTVRE
jgi:hypothetical protein